jgi:hypothetical protein
MELAQFDLKIPTKEHWAKMHESLYQNDCVINISNPKNVVHFFFRFDPNEVEDEKSDMMGITDLVTTQAQNRP